MEPNYLALLCAHLKIEPKQVLSYRTYDTEIVAVIDYGIQGGKKLAVPLAQLVGPDPEPEPPQPEQAPSPKRRGRKR